MYSAIIFVSIFTIANANAILWSNEGSGEEPSVYPDIIESFTRDVNPTKMTNHLKCASCLTECDDIGKSAVSYYLCMVCLEDCGGNRDAMMHYFTTRQCHGVRSAPSVEDGAVIPTQVLGDMLWPDDAAEEPSSDFLDNYLQKQFFSQPKSVNNKPQNPSLLSEYNSVQEQLGQCQRSLQACNSKPSYESYPYSYFDSEGSNYPSDGDDFYGSYSPPEETNKSRLMQKIFEKYSGRFTPKAEVEKLIKKQKKENKRKSLLKSSNGGKGPTGLVCSSFFDIVVPDTAKHISEYFDVTLVGFEDFVQYFSQGRCKGSRPLVNITPPAECKNVENVHLAVFYVSNENVANKSAGLTGCQQMDSETSICEGWIKLPGQCNLFLVN